MHRKPTKQIILFTYTTRFRYYSVLCLVGQNMYKSIQGDSHKSTSKKEGLK